MKRVASVQLPGPSNRFDYTSLDPTTGRLWIAHMNAGQLLVFDARTREVLQTIAAPGVHGVIAVPQLHRVYASATDARQLFTIDSRSGRVLNRAPAGSYPDGLVYDPIERHVFVSDESGGVEAVFDAAGRRIATVQLGGGAGNVQYDSVSGKILVDVQTRNQVAVIDPRSNHVVRRLSVPGCDSPHGLLIDSPRRLAFVACDGNARLLTLDLKTMKFTGSFGVGDGPDVLAFDKARGASTSRPSQASWQSRPRAAGSWSSSGKRSSPPSAHRRSRSRHPPRLLPARKRAAAAIPSYGSWRQPRDRTPRAKRPEQTGGTIAAPARPGHGNNSAAPSLPIPAKRSTSTGSPRTRKRWAFVVTSPSTNTISAEWTSYCEFNSDDDQTLDDHGTVAGVSSVTGYPATFPAATLCYVTITAGASGTARVTGAIFAT